MSEEQQQQPEAPRDTAEVTAIKASHRQEIARLEMDREQSLAHLDAQMFESMPISLRILFDERLYRRVIAVAETMARAEGITPRHLLGKTEACVAVVAKSITWKLDPFSVAQSTYQTPDGKVGYEGRLVQSIMEASGKLTKPIGQGEYFGDWSKVEGKFKIVKGQTSSGKSYDRPEPTWTYWGPEEEGLGVRYKVHLQGQEKPVPFEFKLRAAFPRNAITWPTRTQQQLHYAAMRALGSVVCPSLIMGVPFQGDEHIADTENEMRDVTPTPMAPEPVDLRAEGIRGGGEMKETRQSGAVAAPEPPKAGSKAMAEPPGQASGPSGEQASVNPGETVDPETGEVTETQQPGKRRRSYRQITNDVIVMLGDAETEGDVDEILADEVTGGVRANGQLMSEIDAAAQAARQRIAEVGADRAGPPTPRDAQPSPPQSAQPAEEAAGPAQHATAGLFPQG